MLFKKHPRSFYWKKTGSRNFCPFGKKGNSPLFTFQIVSESQGHPAEFFGMMSFSAAQISYIMPSQKKRRSCRFIERPRLQKSIDGGNRNRDHPRLPNPSRSIFPAYLKNGTKTPQGNFCLCTDPGQRKIPSYHSACSLFKESRGYLRQAALFYPSGCTPYISQSPKRGRCTPFPAARCCWMLPEILSSPKERTAPS